MISKAEFVSPQSYSATHSFTCQDPAGKAASGEISHAVQKVGNVYRDTVTSFTVSGKPVAKRDMARIQAAINKQLIDLVTPSCNLLGAIRIELRTWDPTAGGTAKVSAIILTRDASGAIKIQ